MGLIRYSCGHILGPPWTDPHQIWTVDVFHHAPPIHGIPPTWWEKMGILARSLPGNLTIWREILTFEIKKYIRNSGKYDYLAGKNTFFQDVPTDTWYPKRWNAKKVFCDVIASVLYWPDNVNRKQNCILTNQSPCFIDLWYSAFAFHVVH